MTLDTYVERVRSITEGHSARIRAYAREAQALLPADADARRSALSARNAGADSLAGVAGVVFSPREHALTLAWLLDSERSDLPVLARLVSTLGIDAPDGELTVSHDISSVDARVFDVRIDGDGWQLGLVLGEAPTNPVDHMMAALDHAFGDGAAQGAHLIWLTSGGSTPGTPWHALTWRTLDTVLAEFDDNETVAEYRRVVREQVFRELPPSAVRRNLEGADHATLCAIQKG